MSDVPASLVNIEGEAALLGAMMIENDLIGEWADRLLAEDFHEPLHRRIFNALLRFQARGVTANAVTLRPVFQMDEAAGKGDYLAKLTENPAIVVGAKHIATQLSELAARRKAHAAVMRAAIELEQDFEQAIGEITGRIEETAFAAEARTDISPPRTLGDLVGIVQARDARIKEGAAPGLRNVLVPDFDVVATTLERQHYLILAGRPGMGKSTTASSVSIGLAMDGNAGLYLLLEGNDEQQAMRMTSDLSFAVSPTAGIEHDRIKEGKLSPSELHRLELLRQRVDLLPLKVRDVGPCDIRQVWSEVAREKARLRAQGKDLAFVVIDHLGLAEVNIDGRSITDDRQRTNYVSRMLNAMKKRLDVAVIALAQVSRAVEAREDKRPRMSDLRDSGNLEQDADTVVLVYREEYYLEQEEPKKGETDNKGRDLHEAWEVDMNAVRNKIELIGGKTRHGQRITRTARFHGRFYAVRGSKYRDDGYDEPLLEI